jgi:hypothetical protein
MLIPAVALPRRAACLRGKAIMQLTPFTMSKRDLAWISILDILPQLTGLGLLSRPSAVYRFRIVMTFAYPSGPEIGGDIERMRPAAYPMRLRGFRRRGSIPHFATSGLNGPSIGWRATWGFPKTPAKLFEQPAHHA